MNDSKSCKFKLLLGAIHAKSVCMATYQSTCGTTYLTTYPPAHSNYLPKYKPECTMMCKQLIAAIHYEHKIRKSWRPIYHSESYSFGYLVDSVLLVNKVDYWIMLFGVMMNLKVWNVFWLCWLLHKTTIGVYNNIYLSTYTATQQTI